MNWLPVGEGWERATRRELPNDAGDGLSEAVVKTGDSRDWSLDSRVGGPGRRASEASLGQGFASYRGGQVRVDGLIKRLCFSCQFRTG